MRALKKFKSNSQLINTTSVVDRHRFDVDPDPTFYFDAGPDPENLSHQCHKCNKFQYF